MGKDKLTQLSCLMEKLYKIDQELGGTARKCNHIVSQHISYPTQCKFLSEQNAKGKEGEFENALNDCKERMFKIKTNQKEQDLRFEKHGRDKKFIIQETEMRNELNYCRTIVDEMDKILAKQSNNKNIDKTEITRRYKKYNIIKDELFKMMKNRGINPPDDYEELQQDSQGPQTVDQFKNNVFESAKKKKGGDNNQRKEANDKELSAINDMKRRDKEQDVVLDRIYDTYDALHGKVKNMGGKIDHIGVQIGDINKKVDDTQKVLDTQNQRLKDLLTKYRQPNKFCLDVTLVIFLLGLVGVGYKMLKA